MISLLQDWATIASDECNIQNIGRGWRVTIRVGTSVHSNLVRSDDEAKKNWIIRLALEEAIAARVQANGWRGFGLEYFALSREWCAWIGTTESFASDRVVFGATPLEALLGAYLKALEMAIVPLEAA